jgi:hypothetical protein
MNDMSDQYAFIADSYRQHIGFGFFWRVGAKSGRTSRHRVAIGYDIKSP